MASKVTVKAELRNDRFHFFGRLFYFDLTALSLALIVIAMLAAAVLRGIDPHVDEAMLVANLKVMSLSDIFRSMPLYEQAAPVGYALSAVVTNSVFGDTLLVPLRLFSIAALGLSALLLTATLRAMGRICLAPAAMAVILLSPLVVLYGVTIKHYIFELCAMCLVLLAGATLVRSPDRARRHALFGAALALIAPWVTAALLIVGSVGGGVLAHILFASTSATWRRRLALGCVSVGAALVFAGFWHVAVDRPILEMQFSAYADVYDSTPVGIWPPDLSAQKAFARLLAEVVSPLPKDAPPVLNGIFLALLMLGVVAGGRRFLWFALAFVLLVGGMAFLNTLGLLPKFRERHLLFVLPLSSVLFAEGLRTALGFAVSRLSGRSEPAHVRKLAGFLSLGVVLIGALPGFLNAWANVERQQISPLIAHIQSSQDRDATVFAALTVQPVLAALEADLDDVIGWVDPASLRNGWATPYVDTTYLENGGRVREPSELYLDLSASLMRGHERVWIIIGHLRSGMRWSEMIATAERVVGPCRETLRAKESVLLMCTAGDPGLRDANRAGFAAGSEP